MGARYKAVYRGGKLFAEYENGELIYVNPEYSAPKRSETVKAPMYMRDIGEYRSPIDGSLITSRSAHREHMRQHDVIEVGNERMPQAPSAPPKPDRELGMAIKRRLEEVDAMPQAQYDAQVQEQQAEHAEIASLITATPTE